MSSHFYVSRDFHRYWSRLETRATVCFGKSSKVAIDVKLSKCFTLTEQRRRDGNPWYAGSDRDFDLLTESDRATVRLMQGIYGILVGSTSFWAIIKGGICNKEKDKEIAWFHVSLFMLFTYPYMAMYSKGFPEYKPLLSLESLPKEIALLKKLLGWLDRFTKGLKSIPEYYKKLKAHPQLLRKVEMLSLSMYSNLMRVR